MRPIDVIFALVIVSIVAISFLVVLCTGEEKEDKNASAGSGTSSSNNNTTTTNKTTTGSSISTAKLPGSSSGGDSSQVTPNVYTASRSNSKYPANAFPSSLFPFGTSSGRDRQRGETEELEMDDLRRLEEGGKGIRVPPPAYFLEDKPPEYHA